MFFAVYQANSSRSACTRKGHGSNLVHARAFHTGYSQAHWGFSDCCFEVDKDIRQNTLWKTCARWCHHCWTRRNVALSRVKKNKLWIWKAYRRETGELIDWECGGRDKGTLSKLMERLSRWKVELFCTDNWGVYPEVIVADKLYQSKSQTVYLEQNNGRQRHWFARFRRKSIVVSKTLEMVDLTMALFARFHVNGSWKDIASLFSWHPQKNIAFTNAAFERPMFIAQTKMTLLIIKSANSSSVIEVRIKVAKCSEMAATGTATGTFEIRHTGIYWCNLHCYLSWI